MTTKPCPVCGDPVPQKKTGRPRIYCLKRACRDIAWRSGTAKQTRAQKTATLRSSIAASMQRSGRA